MDLSRPEALPRQTIVRGDVRVPQTAKRPHVIDDVTCILTAARKTTTEEMNDRHPLRRHACGRMIDIEQEIDVPTLAENDVGVHFQVAGVLGLGPGGRGGKTCQCRNCGKRPRRFHKTTSTDLLHLFPLPCRLNCDDHTPSGKSSPLDLRQVSYRLGTHRLWLPGASRRSDEL